MSEVRLTPVDTIPEPSDIEEANPQPKPEVETLTYCVGRVTYTRTLNLVTGKATKSVLEVDGLPNI